MKPGDLLEDGYGCLYLVVSERTVHFTRYVTLLALDLGPARGNKHPDVEGGTFEKSAWWVNERTVPWTGT